LGYLQTRGVLGDQDAILGHVASRGDRTSPWLKVKTLLVGLSTGSGTAIHPPLTVPAKIAKVPRLDAISL
jgi:hypothetical protein